MAIHKIFVYSFDLKIKGSRPNICCLFLALPTDTRLLEKSVKTFPWELLPPNPSQEDVDKVYSQNTDKLWSVMNQLYRRELEAEQRRVQQLNTVVDMHDENVAMHRAAMPSPATQAVVMQPVSTLPAAMQVATVAEAAVASLDALPAAMLSTVALPEAMQQVEAAPAITMQAGPGQPHRRVVTVKATTVRVTMSGKNRGNSRSASIL